MGTPMLAATRGGASLVNCSLITDQSTRETAARYAGQPSPKHTGAGGWRAGSRGDPNGPIPGKANGGVAGGAGPHVAADECPVIVAQHAIFACVGSTSRASAPVFVGKHREGMPSTVGANGLPCRHVDRGADENTCGLSLIYERNCVRVTPQRTVQTGCSQVECEPGTIRVASFKDVDDNNNLSELRCRC